MSSWFWLVIAVGTVVIAGGLADFILLGRPGYAPVPLVMDATPTLFIPGHLGTRYSFGHMLWRMQRRYGLSKDVVAIVERVKQVEILEDKSQMLTSERCFFLFLEL